MKMIRYLLATAVTLLLISSTCMADRLEKETIIVSNGTQKVTINTNGNVTATGTSTSSNAILSSVNWIDLIAPGFTLAGGAAAPTQIITGVGMGINGMGYDTNDTAYGVLQMPHGLALTNSTRTQLVISPHVHWSMTNNPTTNTNVTWQLVYEWANLGAGFIVKGTSTVTVAQTIGTNAVLTEFADITNNAAGISSIFRFRLGRVASSTNDYGGTARIILDQFDIHVPVDRAGSSQELTQ